MLVKKVKKKVHKLIKVLTLLALLCNSPGGAWYNPWIRSLPDKSIKSSPTPQLLSLRSCHWSTLTVPLHLGNLFHFTLVICSSTSFYIWFSPLNADTLLTSSTFYISFKLKISFHVFFSRGSMKNDPWFQFTLNNWAPPDQSFPFLKMLLHPSMYFSMSPTTFLVFPIQVHIYICPVLNFRLKTSSSQSCHTAYLRNKEKLLNSNSTACLASQRYGALMSFFIC